MLKQLLKLYKRTPHKTPLEDFITETFVGILNMEPIIKKHFIENFLNLPAGNYSIKTQVRYKLKNEAECIVDIVIESKSILCFVENKVNSKQGYRQLERYNLVLNNLSEKKNDTFLKYCTKHNEIINFTSHRFEHFRWHKVAAFLKGYIEISIVKDFYDFLESFQMTQDLNFNRIDIDSIKNMKYLIQSLKAYLDHTKPSFVQLFRSSLSDGAIFSQVTNYNRFVYYRKKILPSTSNASSEIMYGFDLEIPSIFVTIYVDERHEYYDKFLETFSEISPDFTGKYYPNLGTGLINSFDINKLLDLEDGQMDIKIIEWFKNNLAELKKYVDKTSHFDWHI
jgi:hypothetical protein